MRPIDSSILSGIKRALGLGSGGAQVTDLDDGQVIQVVDIGRSGSRQDNFGPGIFFCRLQSRWTAGDDTTPDIIQINPYEAGAYAAAPFPASVPDGYDLYLHDARVDCLTNSGTPFATLSLVMPSGSPGFGKENLDSSPLALSLGGSIVLGNWTTIEDSAAGNNTVIMVATPGEAVTKIHTRIPRGGILSLAVSHTATTVNTVNCWMLLESVKTGLAGPDY